MLTCFVVMSTCWTVRRWREKKPFFLREKKNVFEEKKNVVFFFFFFFFQKFDIIRGGVSKNPTRHKNLYGQNIAENGNNTILNDNIPLPNA